MEKNSIIECRGVSFTYGSGTPFEVRALDSVDLDIEKGLITALIGHTGSGKSTLIQTLNALIKPDSGKVLYEGADINANKASARDVRFKVGLCFQYPEHQLFESTVYKDIAFGPKNMGLDEASVDRNVRDAAALAGLDEELFGKSPFELSGGQKRRAAIAGVMAMKPEVLILDEPSAGLDPAGRRDTFDMIRRYREGTGKTVIIVSHSMDDVAELADRIAVVRRGKIAFYGTVDEVFSHSAEMAGMGLSVPEVTRITDALRAAGVPLKHGIYTLSEAAEELIRCYRQKNGGRG